MKNKKGGFGAKLLLVLILMIASAIGGAYGYRVMDGKLAVKDALKAVENVDVSDYDTTEQSIIQGYIDDAKKDLETAVTRKEVYEIITDFIANVDKVQTKAEKELEAALREAEEYKSKYESSGSSSSSGSGGYKSNDLTDADDGTEDDEESNGGLLNSLLGGLSSGSDN